MRYEQICDDDDLRHIRRQQTWRRIATVTALAAIGLMVFVQQVREHEEHGYEQQHTSSQHHLLPTLLYVVDPLTGNYLNALKNPLYEQLKAADLIERLSATEVLHQPTPELVLDRALYRSHDPLTLTWNDNGGLVKDDDMIVLYCGKDDDDDDVSRLDHFLEAATVAHARTTSQKHGGSLSLDNQWYFPNFPITQHPTCQFALYQTIDPTTFALLTKSHTFAIDGPEQPSAIHLAFTDDPTELLVQFTTFVEGSPTVWYWIADKEDRKELAEGVSHTYTADDLCQAPANVTEAGKFQPPGWQHRVTLTELQPDTDYYYQVGIQSDSSSQYRHHRSSSSRLAGPFNFRSPPPRGDTNPFNYVVYGDQGVVTGMLGDQGKWTAAMVARELDFSNNNLRAIHHFGDLSYAMGAAHVWDDWFYQISSFSPHLPLMISVGNHEYDHTDGGANGKDPSNVVDPHGYMPSWGNFGDDSGGECGVPTAARFTMPKSKGSNGVFWYSYDMASVHTIVLSSEHDLTKRSPQHEWLEADLKSVDRSLTPWLVVELHRPLYEAEPSVPNNAVGVAMRHSIEDLLMDYNVDVVLAGHYHAYHRTCDGLYRGKCHVTGAPMHITVGSAGATLDPNLPLFPFRWTEKFIGQEFGYGRITVFNATVMRFDFVKAGPHEDPTAGDIRDTAWIVRKR